MSTAAVDTTEATAVDLPEPTTPFERDNGKVLFLARRSNLRLVMEPIVPRIQAATGRQIGEVPGRTVEFREGQFSCPRAGAVVLSDGREADAEEVLAFLNGHRLLGDVNGGFWEVNPEAPAVSQAELEALVRAAGEGDEETLEVILQRERDGWQRAEILHVAAGALERVKKVNELMRREEELAAREAALVEAENDAKVAAQPTPPAVPDPRAKEPTAAPEPPAVSQAAADLAGELVDAARAQQAGGDAPQE